MDGRRVIAGNFLVTNPNVTALGSSGGTGFLKVGRGYALTGTTNTQGQGKRRMRALSYKGRNLLFNV